jgi:hypothetical protein
MGWIGYNIFRVSPSSLIETPDRAVRSATNSDVIENPINEIRPECTPSTALS